jgi:quinol monooxygenase YgiN
MRAVMLALMMMGAMALPAAAQTPKPAAKSNQVFWVFTLKVEPDQYEHVRQLVSRIVASVEEKEPGTLEYEWNISADRTTLVVFERYSDSASVVQHVNDFGPFAKEFFALAKPMSLVVFGAPDAEVKKEFAKLNPVYMTTFDGFTR